MTLSGEIKTPSRRALVAGAAWAAPLVVVSAAAPAYASSMCTFETAAPWQLRVDLGGFSGKNLLALDPVATLTTGDANPSDPSDGGGDDDDPPYQRYQIDLSDPRLSLFTLAAGQQVMGLSILLIFNTAPTAAPPEVLTFSGVDTSSFDVVSSMSGPIAYGRQTAYRFTYTVTLLRDVVGLSAFLDLWDASFASAVASGNGANEINGIGGLSAQPTSESALYTDGGACEAVTLDAFGSSVSIDIAGRDF